RLSTTICWPSDLLILSATMRPSASLPPPGGNGMTSVTGRAGYAWASARCGASDTAVAPRRARKARRLIRHSRVTSEPANRGFIGILELRNAFAMAQRKRYIVRTGQQALLAERIDVKPVDRAVRPCHRLRFEVDGDVASWRLLQQASQCRN